MVRGWTVNPRYLNRTTARSLMIYEPLQQPSLGQITEGWLDRGRANVAGDGALLPAYDARPKAPAGKIPLYNSGRFERKNLVFLSWATTRRSPGYRGARRSGGRRRALPIVRRWSHRKRGRLGPVHRRTRPNRSAGFVACWVTAPATLVRPGPAVVGPALCPGRRARARGRPLWCLRGCDFCPCFSHPYRCGA